MATSNTISENDISKISNSKQKPNPYVPNSGKIYRGPTKNAYTKNNIGTISSSIETLLFKKPAFINEYNANNGLFISQGDNLKVSISQARETSPHSFLSNSSSTKSVSSIKKSKNKILPLRFDYSNLEYGKYYPGPGDYSPPNYSSIRKSNNFRYKSLFEVGRENVVSYIYTDNNKDIGPGSYDVKLDQKANVYISPYERFIKPKISETDRKVGPGTYDVNFDFRRNDKGKTSFFFKKQSTNPNSTSIDEIKNKLFLSTENNDLKKGDIDNCLSRRNKKLPIAKSKKEKPKNINEIKQEIQRQYIQEPEKIKEKDKKEGEYEKLINMYNYCVNNESSNVNNKYNHVMNSKTPRLPPDPIKLHQHVPGPCYYQNYPLKYKKYFNANMNNKWI